MIKLYCNKAVYLFMLFVLHRIVFFRPKMIILKSLGYRLEVRIQPHGLISHFQGSVLFILLQIFVVFLFCWVSSLLSLSTEFVDREPSWSRPPSIPKEASTQKKLERRWGRINLPINLLVLGLSHGETRDGEVGSLCGIQTETTCVEEEEPQSPDPGRRSKCPENQAVSLF